MRKKCLILVAFLVISLLFPITNCATTEEEIKTFNIQKPENFLIEKKGNDLHLSWNSVENASVYKVYWSQNKTATFPEDWNSEIISGTNWTHTGALEVTGDIFYMVRGINGSIEGTLSYMGYKVDIELLSLQNNDRSWNWISIPYHEMDFNGDGEYTAKDIIYELEGGYENGENEIIDRIAIYNSSRESNYQYNPYYDSRYYPIMNYTESGWNLDNDFNINVGDALGLNVTSNYTWTLCGVENTNKVLEYYDEYPNKNYKSIPYTLQDINKDSRITSFDIIYKIEGNLYSANIIDSAYDWDTSSQGTKNDTSYDYLSEIWLNEFIINPGDVIGFTIESSFNWTPPLINYQPPTIRDVQQNTNHLPINSNLTLRFTRTMNKTSVENNIYSNDFNFTTSWNDNILKINPNTILSKNTNFTLTINYLAKDNDSNFLDGNSDGIPSKSNEDNYNLTFRTEKSPKISHQPPRRWHFQEEIILEPNITDDVSLNKYYINYTDTKGISHNITLNKNLNKITIPSQNRVGEVSYYFYAIDSSGLASKSDIHHINILNLSRSFVKNFDSEYEVLPLNGSIRLNFSKEMNYSSIQTGITFYPNLNYSITSLTNSKYLLNLTNAEPNTNYKIKFNSTLIKDIYGIQLIPNQTIEFTTETHPDINYEQSIENQYKSNNISLSVQCMDDIEMESVYVTYTDPNGNTFMKPLSKTNNWTCNLPRQNHTGELTYRFIAKDISGLKTTTKNYSLMIENPISVNFQNITGDTNNPFTFSVNVVDPIGIRSVNLHYNVDGQQKTKQLDLVEGNAGNGNWQCKINENTVGDHDYSLEITDLDGETVIIQSNNSIRVNESQFFLEGYFLYILLLIIGTAAVTGGILYKRRDNEEKEESETAIEETPISTQPKQENKDPSKENMCTICFGEIEENLYECSGCNNIYHKQCIDEIGECPICGKDPLKELGDVDEQ